MNVTTDSQGRLLVSKDALIEDSIYSNLSYRSAKSQKRFQEIEHQNNNFVLLESLPEQTRKKVIEKYKLVQCNYTQLLLASNAAGLDCAPMAVSFTADTFNINEPFIRSSIETYINTNYTRFTWAYMDFNLHSESVKGYAKHCALIAWTHDFVQRIHTQEPDKKRASQLVRSLRVNMLTAIQKLQFEVKLPTSDLHFTRWFDDTMKKLEAGQTPEQIVTIKRQGNTNRGKITDEQLQIALYWHKNGTNMSIQALYTRWIEYAKQNGWWIINGAFCPPTEGRLYQLITPLKNPLALAKTDNIHHMLNYTPANTRDLPTKANKVWEIDGTAHNENVLNKGTVRQHVYAIKVMDAASMRIVGVAPIIKVREPFYLVKQAILDGIKETGYKPEIIHCDQGPAYTELELWCKSIGVKCYASGVGNARAKTIENMFFQFDNDITRFLNFSGMNRTATGSINSKASEKRETKGKLTAKSASIVMNWLQTEGITAWNERVIKQLNHKECNKTPYELYDELGSCTPKLSYIQLCELCGTAHQRKLTINGLTIEHQGTPYTYFPPIETSEQREHAEHIFTTIPLNKHNNSPLTIYILEGGNPAPVFTNAGKFIGIWEQKKHTAYIAETPEEIHTLNNMTALQARVTNKAKQINAEIDSYVERHPNFEAINEMGNQMLVGKRRERKPQIDGRYSKEALLNEEIEAKAGDFELPTNKPVFKELVDPDTGELIRVRMTN